MGALGWSRKKSTTWKEKYKKDEKTLLVCLTNSLNKKVFNSILIYIPTLLEEGRLE